MKKNPPEEFLTSFSSQECTGLIPSGENMTEDEIKAYKEIYSPIVDKNNK